MNCPYYRASLGDYRNSFFRPNAQICLGQIPDLARVFKMSYRNYFHAQTFIFVWLTKKQFNFPIFPQSVWWSNHKLWDSVKSCFFWKTYHTLFLPYLLCPFFFPPILFFFVCDARTNSGQILAKCDLGKKWGCPDTPPFCLDFFFIWPGLAKKWGGASDLTRSNI